MEKRRAQRKYAGLDAKLITNGESRKGFIENMCEHGLHLITASSNGKVSFIPETLHELMVQHDSGIEASLYCEVRWVHINKTPIHGLTYRMGMEILKAPPEYSGLIDALK